MNLKWKRCLVALLAAALLLTVPLSAVAATLPEGFTGMDSVNLEVDAGYAWHTMSESEATAYGLSGDNVYIAGNSGQDAGSVSNVAITVDEPGMLTFEYALSTYSDGGKYDLNCYFCYGIGEPVEYAGDSGSVFYTKIIDKGEVLPDESGVWATYTINVDSSYFPEGTTSVNIYIAYHHDPYYGGEADLNFAAIRNVKYVTGSQEGVIRYDSEYTTEDGGTVTAQLITYDSKGNVESLTAADVNDLTIGSTYRLTATANSGYRFYGWIKHYVYEGESYSAFQALSGGNLDVAVSDTTYYIPVFATDGKYILRKGTGFYSQASDLGPLLDNAISGEVIVLLENIALESDATIKNGVTLYVPFRDSWDSEESLRTYHDYGSQDKICDDEAYAHTILTIPEGKTLTVNGELVIGSTIGCEGQLYEGHTSGAHGRINNDGNIEVNGRLTCYGIIAGSGTVTARDHSLVYETMTVCDFSGGSNGAELFLESDQMPFKRFAVQNIQCTLQTESAASLYGLASIWASSAHNEADIPLVGPTEKFAFQTDGIADGSIVLVRTYDRDKNLNGTGVGHVDGIGHTHWDVDGGLTFRALSVSLAGVTLNTSVSDLPIPYNFSFSLDNGLYDVAYGVRIMPGAQIVVESNATLRINGALYAMDGLVQTDMSGDRYPSYAELVSKGFPGTGELIVNGTLKINPGASLGGLIQSDGGGMLVIAEGAYLDNRTADLSKLNQAVSLIEQAASVYDSWAALTYKSATSSTVTAVDNWVLQDGGPGAYDENTTWFNLPARFIDAEGNLTMITEAGTYKASACQTTVAEYPYECLYVKDGVFGRNSEGLYRYLTASGVREMTDGSFTFERSVSGSWSNQTADLPITGSVAGSGTSSAVTNGYVLEIDAAKDTDGNTVISSITVLQSENGDAATQKFVHLVKYTTSDNAEGYTVEPVDGVYTIGKDDGATGIIIQTALLGDVNGSGALDGRDVANLRKAMLNTLEIDELATLAGDINGSGALDGRDIANLRKAVLGTYVIGS